MYTHRSLLCFVIKRDVKNNSIRNQECYIFFIAHKCESVISFGVWWTTVYHILSGIFH